MVIKMVNKRGSCQTLFAESFAIYICSSKNDILKEEGIIKKYISTSSMRGKRQEYIIRYS